MPSNEKDKGKIIIEGVDTSDLEMGDLLRMAVILYGMLKNERLERSAAHMMCDKIHSALELTMNETEEIKAELFVMAVQVEEEAKKPGPLIQELEEKAKYNRYNTEKKLEAVKKAADHTADRTKAKWVLNVGEPLLAQKIKCKVAVDELVTEQFQMENRIRDKYAKEMEDVKRTLKELTEKAAEKTEERHRIGLLQVAFNQKTEVALYEEQCNQLLQALVDSHERNFEFVKEFFKSATETDITLISKLTKECTTLEERIRSLRRENAEILEENEKLREPEADLMKMSKKLERNYQNYLKDLKNLDIHTKMINRVEAELAHVKEVGISALNASFEDEAKERSMKKYLEEKCAEMATQKNEVLAAMSNRIRDLLETESEKRKQIMTLLGAQEELKPAYHILESWRILFEKVDFLTEQLEFNITRTRKAHDDLITTLTAKLKEMVDKKVCEFPYISTKGVKHRRGPANLVARLKY